jgi:hypothetical protein
VVPLEISAAQYTSLLGGDDWISNDSAGIAGGKSGDIMTIPALKNRSDRYLTSSGCI